MNVRSTFLSCLLLAVSVPTTVFGQTTTPSQSLTAETKEKVLAGIARVIKNQAFVPGVELSKWDEFVVNEKEKIDKASTDAEFAEAVREAISKFGISHMVLMTPQAAKARVERKAVGIGVTIQPQEDGLLITNVFDDTPAKENGLVPGDLIMEADGKKLTSTSTILGDEGTQVVLKVRKGDGVVRSLTLTRRKFSNVRPETLAWISPDTAVLRIPTFDLSYNRKRIDELMAEARKAKNLVLDLRSNGGGAVINMLHLLGYLLPSDTQFGLFVTRSLVSDFVEETGAEPTELRKISSWAKRGWLKPSKVEGGPFAGRLAVLINGGTGSASEITAAAAKEFLGAPIVGTKSAGAVLVSTMASLSDGWQLQYPLSDYITAQGRRLEGSGVEPEVVAPMPKFGEHDDAIDKAVALLKRIELRNSRGGSGGNFSLR